MAKIYVSALKKKLTIQQIFNTTIAENEETRNMKTKK